MRLFPSRPRRRRTAPVGALLAAALAVLTAGCGDTDAGPGSGDSGRPAAAVDDDLATRVFVSTGLVGPAASQLSTTRVRLEFGTDSISAQAGCNTLSGSAGTVDGRLRVERLGGTEMGCDPARMRQDSWLASFLAADPAYRLEGDRLTLSGDRGTLTLVDAAAVTPVTPLVGTRWVLDGVVTGSGPTGTVASVPRSARATLRVDNGQLLLRLGCNVGSAPVRIDGHRLLVGPLAQTLRACSGAAAEVEEAIVATLQDAVRHRVDGETLTLSRAGRGLVYRARPAGTGR